MKEELNKGARIKYYVQECSKQMLQPLRARVTYEARPKLCHLEITYSWSYLAP